MIYKKIRLTKKNANFPTKFQKLQVSRKNTSALRGFLLELVASSMRIPFDGFHLRWGSDIQFLVDNVEASHLYGLQVNRRGIPKAGHVGVMLARGKRLLAASALFCFFFSEGQVFRSDGSDTRFGPYLLKVRYPGKFLLNRHGFMCVYGSKIGSMPPKKTFFSEQIIFY